MRLLQQFQQLFLKPGCYGEASEEEEKVEEQRGFWLGGWCGRQGSPSAEQAARDWFAKASDLSEAVSGGGRVLRFESNG